MKPTILQRILFILLLLGGLVLGVVVASGFLILALLLIPIILVRFYLHKRSFEKAVLQRQAEHRAQDGHSNSSAPERPEKGVVIEGEVVKKRQVGALKASGLAGVTTNSGPLRKL